LQVKTLTGILQKSVSQHAKIERCFELITNSISRTRKRTSIMIKTGPVIELIINMGAKVSK